MDDPLEAMPAAMPPPQLGPTVDDLTLDDSLDDMERIARYGVSAIPVQRLVHVRLIADTCRAAGCVDASTRWVATARHPRCRRRALGG